jgi:DNA-binding MarR family transcriptional regulator
MRHGAFPDRCSCIYIAIFKRLVNLHAVALNPLWLRGDFSVTEGPSKQVVLAWARLLKAERLALGRVEAALKQARLPPLAWYDVLLELDRAGETGLRPFELERALLLAQYNLSRLLDRIEHEGLIDRAPCPQDGRGQVLHLTANGRSMRNAMWPVYAQAIEAALGSCLDETEAETLSALLARIIDAEVSVEPNS